MNCGAELHLSVNARGARAKSARRGAAGGEELFDKNKARARVYGQVLHCFVTWHYAAMLGQTRAAR